MPYKRNLTEFFKSVAGCLYVGNCNPEHTQGLFKYSTFELDVIVCNRLVG
jgi:hypothetical protein